MIAAVGHYNVLERLGGGALGDVFRARDTRTGRTVALMVASPELIASPARRSRFLEDARAAAKLNHPNIAMLFDVVEQDDRCYLAYEFAAGPSLRDEMGGAAVDASHALHLAAHIADALAEGHAKGIVHGDLRPDTIVVTPKGSVKVLNFGMTKWTKGAVARAKAVSTPGSLDPEETEVTGYLSPEQAVGATTADPRSDLFALGVVLYQMLTGRQPFAAATADGTIANVLRQTPKRPSAVNPELPAEIDGIVMKLLAKELDARYQTAAVVATDIRRVAAELDRRMSEPPRPAVSSNRRRVLIGAAIGVVILVLTHTAPAPGPFDVAVGARAVWHMPRTSPATVYLTYDDGPNAATTPLLLDVLRRERAHATFFLVDREITDRTVPIVARMFAEGHGVALHSDSRLDLLMSPAAFARKLTTNADRIERLTGHRPIRAFRPHAGWRSATMYEGLRRIDYRLIGWGWMRWDWNWYRQRTADATVPRVMARIQPGDIVVMHDGDVYNPSEDQRHAVEATARLVPLLRAKGYAFGRF